MCFFSSFGQTFFIALFAKDIAAAGELSNGGFGLLYSTVNLASGGCVLWLGARIDRSDERLFCIMAAAGLAAACLMLALAGDIVTVAIALFGLRLFGQGLMSHAALTTVVRHLGAFRGRGVALAALGFSVGEAVLPSLGVGLRASLGWQRIWFCAAFALVFVLIPLLWTLLPSDKGPPAATRPAARPAWWLLRDRHFPWLFPLVLAPSFTMTGIFFQQVALVDAKGWSMPQFASAFIVYAASTIVVSLVAGWLADRVGATRLLPLVVLPLCLACIVLASGRSTATIFLFMALAGLTTGSFATITTSAWAELYGLADLGGVRALVATATILSAAAAPASFGQLLDGGITVETIVLGCAGLAAASGLIAWIALPGTSRS